MQKINFHSPILVECSSLTNSRSHIKREIRFNQNAAKYCAGNPFQSCKVEALSLFCDCFCVSGTLNNYGNTFCGREENASVLCHFDPDFQLKVKRGKKQILTLLHDRTVLEVILQQQNMCTFINCFFHFSQKPFQIAPRV